MRVEERWKKGKWKKKMKRCYSRKSFETRTIHAFGVKSGWLECSTKSHRSWNFYQCFMKWGSKKINSIFAMKQTNNSYSKKKGTLVWTTRFGESNCSKTERPKTKAFINAYDIIFLCNGPPNKPISRKIQLRSKNSLKQKLWIKFTFAVIVNSMKFHQCFDFTARKRDFPKQIRFTHSLTHGNQFNKMWMCECVFFFSQASKNNHCIRIEIMHTLKGGLSSELTVFRSCT